MTTDDTLGPAGERALDAFKQRARTAETRARQLRRDLAELRADTDRRIDAAHDAGYAQALADQQHTMRVASRILVAALGRLHHPSDALVFIDVASTADSHQAAEQAVAELIEARPYLGRPPAPYRQRSTPAGPDLSSSSTRRAAGRRLAEVRRHRRAEGWGGTPTRDPHGPERAGLLGLYGLQEGS